MKNRLNINGIEVIVTEKNIKHIYLSIKASSREVRLSVPKNIKEEEIIKFIYEKENWIRKNLSKIENKVVVPKLKVAGGNYLYYFGDKIKINMIYVDKYPLYAELEDKVLKLHIKKDTNKEKKEELVTDWYRKELEEKMKVYINKWEKIMNTQVYEIRTKKMKTRWGTCNVNKRRIWINLELAKLAEEYLEYIIVHEMVHLFERGHGDRFKSLMTSYYPNWRRRKEELNNYIIL